MTRWAGKTVATTTICLEGPLDPDRSLDLFRRSGDDLIDRWDGTRLIRTADAGGATGGKVAYAVLFADQPSGAQSLGNRPLLEVNVEGGSEDLAAAVRCVRETFLPIPPCFGDLTRRDPVVARLAKLYPGLRPVRQFDLLAALARCITSQQVHLRFATATRRALAEAVGDIHHVAGLRVYSLAPERLAGSDVARLRNLQLSAQKAMSLVAVARAIANGRLELGMLAGMPDDEIVDRLVALPGIGPWTADWILCRTLGRPRVVAGDLAVRKAVGMAYLGVRMPSQTEVLQATAHWGESALVAQALLLHGYGSGVLAAA